MLETYVIVPHPEGTYASHGPNMQVGRQ